MTDEEQSLLADRDVANAVLCGSLANYDDLVSLSKNMADGYQAPSETEWFWPPTILDGGEVSPWTTGKPFAPSPAEYDGLLVSEENIHPADSDEAPRIRDAYVGRLQQWAASFTSATFDWLLLRFPLGGELNLLDRLSGIRDAIVSLRVSDGSTKARKVSEMVNSLLHEVDRLTISDEIEAWYAGRKSDEDDTAYWQDFDRHVAELQAIKADWARWLREYVAAEDAQWDA